jgi:hypothetical protein
MYHAVDDGTGVIDCAHPTTQLRKPPPKQEAENKYKRVETVSPPPLPPKPIASVGQFVRVSGIVRPQFESRILNVDQIGLSLTGSLSLFSTN